MSGKRILDAVALLGPLRNIATGHFAIRLRQADLYTKTSSVFKALQAQGPGPLAAAAQSVSQSASRASEALESSRPLQPSQPSSAAPKTVKQEQEEDEQEQTAAQTVNVSWPGPEDPGSEDPGHGHGSAKGQPCEGPSEGRCEESSEGRCEEPCEEPCEEQMAQIFSSPRVARMLNKAPTAKAKGSAPGTGQRRSFHATALARQQRPQTATADELSNGQQQPGRQQMRESAVPSSRMGRLFEYGGLAASMAFGAVSESISRSGGPDGSLLLSPSNTERLVAKLSKMRGAALKLGQMMSFQDHKMLPKPIYEVLQRVQDSADYMPVSQRDQVIAASLGPKWRDLFAEISPKPIAAASIGQVHTGVLKDGRAVAVKVQYPGVADSISSDLNNLSLLLMASRLLPNGLYLDKTIANARTELAWECDYVREAQAAKKFRQLLAHETDVFSVPEIIDQASGAQVLTMELMHGGAVTKMDGLSQQQRDWIGTQILRLCLLEIVDFHYMQTDPNWTNFLYNRATQKLELLDFGASRPYDGRFIELYVRVLHAASRKDRRACEALSIELGYLTGYESKQMVKAHVDSILTLAEPFMVDAPDLYHFCDQTITDRVRALIPLMVRERLTPPPEETYSLHRKLSGAFLLCAKLGSRIRSKDLFQDALGRAQSRSA